MRGEGIGGLGDWGTGGLGDWGEIMLSTPNSQLSRLAGLFIPETTSTNRLDRWIINIEPIYYHP